MNAVACEAPITRDSITRRVYDSFPSGHYCLPALLRILRVVETDAIDTAAVECCATPSLLVNPDFVGRAASTPEKLLVLVLHELHHVILGHTRLYRRATALDNLAFDAVINAMLSHLLPGPEYTAMFTDFYDDASPLECFLRPAVGWRPDGRVVVPFAFRKDLDSPEVRALAELHGALYSRRGVGYDELRDALAPLLFARLGHQVEARALPTLLGDHRDEEDGASSAGDLERRAPALLESIREIVERWPQPPTPIAGRSYSALLEERRVTPLPATPGQALRRAIGRVADIGTNGRAGLATASRPTRFSSAVPQVDRRSVVQRSLGLAPLLFERELDVARVLPAGERVHVYVDVSGSVAALVPMLYGALLACRDVVHPVVHAFSTQVADTTFAELREGRVRTTGGTDIACVAAHLREHRVRRAVLVTDGYTGQPAGSDATTLAGVRLAVVLTPGASTRGDLAACVDHWEQLS